MVQDAFKGVYGRTLNFVAFKRAIHKLDKWYHDKGILGQVRKAAIPIHCTADVLPLAAAAYHSIAAQ